jgi:hypothetical protein
MNDYEYETTSKIKNNNRYRMNNELSTNNDAELNATVHEQN